MLGVRRVGEGPEDGLGGGLVGERRGVVGWWACVRGCEACEMDGVREDEVVVVVVVVEEEDVSGRCGCGCSWAESG